MERWAGLLRVKINPHSGPLFTVAASLSLSPSSKSLTVPTTNAIFFTGDKVEGTGNSVIERLSNNRNIAEILVSKYSRLGVSVNAWVVEASVFNGPFAVYKEFIPCVNSWGEPKCYDHLAFPASSSTVSLLSKCLEERERERPGTNKESALELAGNTGPAHSLLSCSLSPKADIRPLSFETCCNSLLEKFLRKSGAAFGIPEYVDGRRKCDAPQVYQFSVKKVINGGDREASEVRVSTSFLHQAKTVVFGFSKGGTVLNQLLTELAHTKFLPPSNLLTKDMLRENCSEAWEESQVLPSSKESLLNSISEIHYVDVGLNSAGAYLTDNSVIEKVADRVMHGAGGFRVALHGTPRQWGDSRRSWITNEKERLLQLLEVAAQKTAGRIQVCERLYFGNNLPNLQMHFEIIENLDVS
ncbi:hypothetical protein IFM89_034555 [Coptis chinensis]|uniref:Uncharacterized protein n=1 Tax=Coptis chinensis TaxID=261450 RepID=A0A835HS21_9MAGN|nr:hypothetical protein IFM89_034555 [Coptis chinensis]